MTGWEPSTDAEVALYDALESGDQERYFRILASTELLLPVSADAVAGRSPMGWGTWTADDRTHLLVFTSAGSMRACLAEHAGSARRMRYRDLAGAWPNQDWWLAVNPGLPIEGYLPAWFVAQLAAGDASLPGQRARKSAPTVTKERPAGPMLPAEPRGRLERLEALERAKAAKTAASRPQVELARPLITPDQEPLVIPAPAPEPEPEPEVFVDAIDVEIIVEPDFAPANSVEEDLLEAVESGNTDGFLSTLLLATVLLPVPVGAPVGALPGSPDFIWHPQQIDGEPHIVCYTSEQRMALPSDVLAVRFINLINAWPDPSWAFAVNPGTPVGATLPGAELIALASWAAEMGLGDRTETVATPVASKPVKAEVAVMQKAIAPSQVPFYLNRGYDRVSGFVHRAREVGHLRTPEQLRRALGLNWDGSPFARDAEEIYVLRWSAYRPSLYRLPYGGVNDAAMRAMEGWVIERVPFRGNGFAPGEGGEVIAEFKVDSARLPHGARLLRMTAAGTEEIVAILDADGPRWLRTDGGS